MTADSVPPSLPDPVPLSEGESGPYEPRFGTCREGELSVDDHEAIAEMLSRAFPDDSHWFAGARSWGGMQPEARIVARSGAVVVAHAGARRLVVQVGDTELCVASVGLVAVSPVLQGTGLGTILMSRVGELLDEWQPDFGVLEADERSAAFFVGNGWQHLDPVIGHYNNGSSEGAATLVTSDSGWLLRPTKARLEDWPEGELHWNGQLV